MQLKLAQKQFDKISAQEGAYLNETQDSIQAEVQDNIDKLAQYKNIRMKSEIINIILRLASDLPKGALLSDFRINYDTANFNNKNVIIDIQGRVLIEGTDAQMALVNKMFAVFKNDKELSQYIKNVNLVSINFEAYNDRQVTGFNIHFS
jgi:hypothetical protein